MTDSLAPRKIERLLESLGADTEFAEAVVGDLAEEFAIRLRWDGPAAARRWYYRESLRVAPHLLRHWRRGLRWSDAGYFANVIALSWVCGFVFQAFLGLTVAAMALAIGVSGPVFKLPWTSPFVPAFLWVLNIGVGCFVGYFAAWVGRRAPLPSALSLAAVWTAAVVIANAVVVPPPSAIVIPLWFRGLSVVLTATGIVAGGVFRASKPAPPESGAVAWE